MLPGLARSMMCGNTPVRPDRYGTSDTGHHAAGEAPLSSSRPPADSPNVVPAPSAVTGASDQCSAPVGVRGNSSLRRTASCGKPPAASTTPRVAVIGCPPATTPVTRPSASRSSSLTGVRTRTSTPASSAARNSRPTSAVPLTNCIPRRRVTRSKRWRVTRRVACSRPRGLPRDAERNAIRSGPAITPMPRNEVS